MFAQNFTDETYYAAELDDKLRDGDMVSKRIVSAAESSEATNLKLSEATTAILNSVAKRDPVMEFVLSNRRRPRQN